MRAAHSLLPHVGLTYSEIYTGMSPRVVMHLYRDLAAIFPKHDDDAPASLEV